MNETFDFLSDAPDITSSPYASSDPFGDSYSGSLLQDIKDNPGWTQIYPPIGYNPPPLVSGGTLISSGGTLLTTGPVFGSGFGGAIIAGLIVWLLTEVL